MDDRPRQSDPRDFASERARTKRRPRIIANEFVRDLRTGLDDGELMQKYGLNEGELGRVFDKLIEANLLTGADRTAHRSLELSRRARDLGKYRSISALMSYPPDPHLIFDNYVVTKGNSFAVELARTVAFKSPSRLPYNPVYLYGDTGLGKTHLLSAIANAAREKEVLLVNTADLETELERAARLRCRAELREWLVSAEILLVDDIQLCEGREDVQRDLFSVLSHMTRAQRWIVISSDVPPTHLAGVESRLLSRLRGGVIVGLQMGDARERRNLIRLFLGERSMPEDVIDHLADQITDDVRRLKAAVAQLLTLPEGPETRLTIDAAQAAVPLPEGLQESTKAPEPASRDHDAADPQISTQFDVQVSRFEDMLAGVEGKDREASATRLLKKMLASAESKEEQSLALQIAVGERLRQLRNENGDPKAIQQLEQSLDLLRERKDGGGDTMRKRMKPRSGPGPPVPHPHKETTDRTTFPNSRQRRR